MQVVRLGIIHVRILLRNEHDHPVFGECLIDSLRRPFAIYKQRHDHVREHDDVRQRQNREEHRES